MRILMIGDSIGSYFINKMLTDSLWGGKEKVNFERPSRRCLDHLDHFHRRDLRPSASGSSALPR